MTGGCGDNRWVTSADQSLALAQLFPALVHEVEARGDGADALVVAGEHHRDVGELLHFVLDRGHALDEAVHAIADALHLAAQTVDILEASNALRRAIKSVQQKF